MTNFKKMKSISFLMVLLIIIAVIASCGKKKPTDSSSNTTTSSKTEDNTMDSTTEATTNSTENTTQATNPPTTTTTRPPSANVPEALNVGNPNFKPGAYKGGKFEFRKAGDKTTLGAWWWVLSGIVTPVDGVNVDMILDMLIANNVSEIYLDVSKMVPWDEEEAQGGLTEDDLAAGLVSERHVRGFVKKCSKFGIRVAALTGASGDSVLRWIDPANNNYYINAFADKILYYQANAKADEKFYAIHLDVEPHTMGNKWSQNREKYTQWMADMVTHARKRCDEIKVQLEYDVFAWFTETDMVKDESGKSVNIIDHMTKKCHTLGIMSYYNTAAGQYDRATNTELAYAKKNGSRLIAGTETIKITPNSITYYYSGKDKFISEQKKLRDLINGSGYADNFGGAIHHVYSMYELLTK